MRYRCRPHGAVGDEPSRQSTSPGCSCGANVSGRGFYERILIMRKFALSVVNFLKREDGPTAVEYAVMLALIIVVCITAITAIGTNANKTFQNVADNLNTAS